MGSSLKPDLHQAWFNRGNALLHLGKYYQAISASLLRFAIASYDKALSIKPDKHEAWNNRGLALAYMERYDDALASYDKALLIKPDEDYA